MKITHYFIYKIRQEDCWIKRYSESELTESRNCKKIGECDLTEDFFIDSNEDVFSEFRSLKDVELTFEAEVLDGEKKRFTHTLYDMLIKAKEGILPYISFKEHQVNPNPIITINGSKIKNHV